jgi:outer membrane protein assembly factor BamB
MKTPPVHLFLALLSLFAPDVSLAQADGSQARGTFTLASNTALTCVSSPVVSSSGTVYVGSRNGLSTAPAGRIWAISAGGASRYYATGDWVDAAPVLGQDGTVYAGSWDGNLYALRDTGTQLSLLWSYKAASFINCSPAVARDGTLYFGCGDSNLYSLNPDGTLRWKSPVPDWVDSSPVITPSGLIVFGCWDKNIYAFDVSGRQVWSHATGGIVVASPAVAADGTVYIGSADGLLYALNPDGTEKWSFDAGSDIEGGAVVDDTGNIYFGANNGYLQSLRPDGSLRWRIALGTAISSTPVLRSDGSLLVGGSSFGTAATPGFFACISTIDGSVRWSNAVDDIVDSSAAVGADQRMYFTSYGRLLYTLNGTSNLSPGALWAEHRRDAVHSGRSPADASLSRLSNLSSRCYVGVGDLNSLTVGFSLSGGSKNMLIRAIGPRLADFGLPASSLMATPELTLLPASGSPVLATNTGWSSDASQVTALSQAFGLVGAFPLVLGSADCALLSQLSGGNYTPRVTGLSGTTGIVLVELYDTSPGVGGRLANISARAPVGSGNGVLIAGLVLDGSAPRTLLIRGIGPSLGAFGITTPLSATSLALYDAGQVKLAQNTNWGSAANAFLIPDVASSVGAFSLASGSADSALLVTLLPGAYTVQLSNPSGGTGVGLIEVYEVP